MQGNYSVIGPAKNLLLLLALSIHVFGPAAKKLVHLNCRMISFSIWLECFRLLFQLFETLQGNHNSKVYCLYVVFSEVNLTNG